MTKAASPSAPSRHKVSIRFAASLVSNAINLGASFLAGLLIARSLGPSRYGDLSFLLATFASLAPLADLGASSAFYTFLSEKKRPASFFMNYGVWLLVQAAVIAALILLPSRTVSHRLWLDQPTRTLLLAFVAAFLSTQLWKTTQQVGEAARETVAVQATWIGINLAHLALIGLAAAAGRLTVGLVLALIAAEYAVGIAAFSLRFDWRSVIAAEGPREPLNATLGAYAGYCRPLVLATGAAFLYQYSDRWLLQRFAGSVQQGFFSIGQQFSTVSLLGAAAIINIFWKEVAEAHGEGDSARMQEMHLLTGRRLYFLSAAIACFVAPFSRELIARLLGPAYSSAWAAFAVLLFFPLHQSLGQVNGSYFMATHETRLYFRFAVLSVALSVPLGYLVLAPATASVPGLGLRSTGLALKMVLVQALLVNLQGWVICRRRGWRWPLLYQVTTPLALLVFGFAAFWAGASVFPGPSKTLLALRLACALAIYGALVAAFAARFPSVTGLPRERIAGWLRRLRGPEAA